jgi:hypothetical protein
MIIPMAAYADEADPCVSLEGKGAQYGLCQAYCSATLCGSGDPRASTTACQKLRENFVKQGGTLPLPCEVTCPCGQEWAAFLPGKLNSLDAGLNANASYTCATMTSSGPVYNTICDPAKGCSGSSASPTCSVSNGQNTQTISITPNQVAMCLTVLQTFCPIGNGA